MGNIVGIHLGTTFSAVAQLDDTGRAVIVHNLDGENRTPSVVSIESENDIWVGTEAKKNLGLGDKNVFSRFRRKMQKVGQPEWVESLPSIDEEE